MLRHDFCFLAGLANQRPALMGVIGDAVPGADYLKLQISEVSGNANAILHCTNADYCPRLP
jgi:hypothetical protein